jgi:hypothetical protein
MGLTKAQLEALNDSSFPNNNAGYITPTILRDYNDAVIGNTVNQDVYSTDSASFNSRIAATSVNTSSLVTTASFNAYTSSTNGFTASISTSVGLLQTFSGSQYKTDSASFDSRIAGIPIINTGSFATTGSNTFNGNQTINGFISASQSSSFRQIILPTQGTGLGGVQFGNDIANGTNLDRISGTFTGLRIYNGAIASAAADTGWLQFGISSTPIRIGTDGGDFIISGSTNITGSLTVSGNISSSGNIFAANLTGSTIDTGSLVTTASFNAYTASQDFKNTTFATTASVNALSASIYQTDSTQSNAITNNSSSFATSISASNFNITNNSASVAVTINNLSSSIYQTDATQSNNISELSASNAFNHSRFATTGSNTFIGNQTINGDISASGNISASSLYATNATIINLTTIYETSSVIYSSGSNQFGDELSDVQILSGSVKVVGGLTVNGVSVSTQSVDISSLNAFTASQIVSNSYFATTSSVNDLSASIYSTDSTQSNQINNLTSQTSSYAISSSVKTITDGLQNEIDTLATTASVNDLSGAVYILSQSVDSRLDSIEFLDTTFVTTSSVNDLSASIYSTDSTQSNNISSNSSSIGLLQTFSGSQYKNDSSSFDSRINAITGSGGGSIVGVITTGSATTASQTILGDFKFDTSYTASNPYTSQNGGSNVVYVSYGDIFNGTQSGNDFIYWLDTNFAGVTVSGTGITNGAITGYNYGSDVEVTITTGTITNGASYTFIGPATQTIEVTGSIQATRPLRVVNPTGTKGEIDGNGAFGANSDASIQAGVSWDGGVYSYGNASGKDNLIRLCATSSQVVNNSGPTPFDKPQIAVGQNGNGAFTQISFQGNTDYTNGTITVHQPLFVSQSLSVSGSATFSELTGSLGGFSASIDSRILAAGGQPQVQDDGTVLGNVSSFNFIGAGVTTTVSAGTASVTISGGGGSGSIDTSSLATTGSNTFRGDQSISGSVSVINSANGEIDTLKILPYLSSSTFNGNRDLAVVARGAQYDGTTFVPTAASPVNIIFGSTVASVSATSIVSGSNNIITNLRTAATNAADIIANQSYISVFPSTRTPAYAPVQIGNSNVNGLITVTNNSVGLSSSLALGVPAFGYGTAASIVSSNILGQVTLNPNSSSVNLNTVLNAAALTINGNKVGPDFTSATGSGFSQQNSINVGTTTLFDRASGSFNFGSTTFLRNLYGGVVTATNPLNATASAGLQNTIIFGSNLIVTGSDAPGANNGGSSFFGRYNINDGVVNNTSNVVFAVGGGTSGNTKTPLWIGTSQNVNITGSLIVTGGNLSIDSSANISGSSYYATANAGFLYAPSSASLSNSYTRYGKDGFQIYQYQGQPYAFGVICTADQLNQYTGSQFRWGTVNSLGPIVNYMNMISASFTGSIGGGGAIPGLDYLKNGEILQINRGTTFDKNVYIQQGLYVSQSMGGSTPALTLNGSGATNALVATGSCVITGSLTLNGSQVVTNVSIETANPLQFDVAFNNTTANRITLTAPTSLTGSVRIAQDSELYLPSGSNQQTGIATLDGGNPGTVTVSNSLVTANSIILLTKQTNNHPNSGPVNVSSKGSGTFTITSNHNGDTDVVAFMIINPS